MSVLDNPGYRRVKELYESGKTMNQIAEDAELQGTLLGNIANPRSRSWKVYHTVNFLVDQGLLKKRESSGQYRPANQARVPTHSQALPQKTENFYEQHLADYEKWIGAKLKRRKQTPLDMSGRREIIVISDLHIPDERMDLLTEVAERHKGAYLCLAGDINDFEAFGRFDVKDWQVPNLQSALARTDAVLGFLADHFPNISVLMGNHDLRLPRKAAKSLGPDYYFVAQTFLLWAYEQRHGIKVVHHQIEKENGRTLPGMFFYQQIGDCLIGHVEAAGKPVGKGAMCAHDFFFSYRDFLSLDPFRVVLQAHTHKQSYHRNSLTGIHCFEIGALCDIPAYSMNQPKYGPVQHGYYHLVQYDGVTDINESRLIVMD